MRMTSFCMILFAALAGCGQPGTNDLTGRYARTADEALLVLTDTIEIVRPDKGAPDSYLIYHRSFARYKRPEDTVLNKRRVRQTDARYDAASGALLTDDPGIRYTFGSDGSLHLGRISYRKID